MLRSPQHWTREPIPVTEEQARSASEPPSVGMPTWSDRRSSTSEQAAKPPVCLWTRHAPGGFVMPGLQLTPSSSRLKMSGQREGDTMDVIWAIYATPGKQYATGKNPFGRDCLGYQWATSGAQA